MIRDYESPSDKKRQQLEYMRQLVQRSELENLYGRAVARSVAELPPSFELPRKPNKPKQAYSLNEIRDELFQKLQPFFINNEELLKFINYLDDRNEIIVFDDTLGLFEQKYIQGSKRNTFKRMSTLWEAYKKRFDTKPVRERLMLQPPSAREVERTQLRIRQDSKMNPLAASQLEDALSVISTPPTEVQIPMMFGDDVLEQLRTGRSRLKKRPAKVPVVNEPLPEDVGGVESIPQSVAELQSILGPQFQRTLERPITNELKNEELKAILKANKLPVSGNKNTLIQRLASAGITKYTPSDLKTVSKMKEEFVRVVGQEEKEEEPESLLELEPEIQGTGMLYVPKHGRLLSSQFGRGIKNRRMRRVMLHGIMRAGNDNEDILRVLKSRSF